MRGERSRIKGFYDGFDGEFWGFWRKCCKIYNILGGFWGILGFLGVFFWFYDGFDDTWGGGFAEGDEDDLAGF